MIIAASITRQTYDSQVNFYNFFLYFHSSSYVFFLNKFSPNPLTVDLHRNKLTFS